MQSQQDVQAQPFDNIPTNDGNDQEPNAQDTQNFIVCVRVRPLNPREASKVPQKKVPNVVKIQDNMVIVLDPDTGTEAAYRRDKMYIFDNVFDETKNTQSVFYSTMVPLLDNALNGYNATLFAYGMTGAGKSHTLFGELDPQTLAIQQPGLIFLTLEELFEKIHSPAFDDYEFSVRISYLEIYNEHVRDLLKGDDQNLMILEDPERGVCVADLTETPVSTRKEVMQLIYAGNAKRTMASTAANTFSSRSHAIVQVLIERKEKSAGIKGTVLQSKLSLIDLAGSERAAVTENRGIRMLEGANINRSLLALGNCINILSDSNKKGAFVPYRDSKLTRLLKDSLGGNTKTIMVACVSPSYMCYEETINTLKYASRAKNIKRKLQKNVKEVELHVSQYKEIIESLKGEIEVLKGQLKTKNQEENGKGILGGENRKGPIVPSSIPGQSLEEEEKKIEEASHKIFENLEQNWEINQTLRELNELELQNRDTLQNLYQHLENTSEEEKIYREQILRQIETLKATMESNEKIKRDIVNTLKGNLQENRDLKDQLVEFASSVDTLEDVELARKLLDIDRLDILTQNMEIKKEALNLAKTRVQQNKQISQMEEEMRMMKAKLEEKERMLMNNHELIQNLKTKIAEQNNPRKLSQIDTKEEVSTLNEFMQGFQPSEYSTISGKEEQLEQKTSVLKNLLINLEKKITKSLHELDSKVAPNYERDLEDLEMLEALRILDNESSRTQRYTNGEKVKTFEEYNQEQKERPSSRDVNHNSVMMHDDGEEGGTVRTILESSSRRSLGKDMEDSVRSEKRGYENNMMTESLTSLQQNSTARTPSDILQRINIYEKPNFTARSKVSEYPNPSNPLHASRLRLPVKGLSTGVLETSNRIDNTDNTMNLGDMDETHTGKNKKENFFAEAYDSNHAQTESSYHPRGHSSLSNRREEGHYPQIYSRELNPGIWGNNSVCLPTDGGKTPVYLQEGFPGKQAENTESDKEKSDWQARRQSFQQVMKGKIREQSAGNIRRSCANNQLQQPELIKHSNSILGIYRDKFFESVIGPEIGHPNDSISAEKRGLEIRSLGQEREHLKLFRIRLNNFAAANVAKLNKEVVEQIKILIEEYKVKKYILSVKDQEALRMLGEAVLNFETRAPETRQKRSMSIKEKDESAKVRSSSVKGSQNLKENKTRRYDSSKERRSSQQADNDNVPPKRNSVRNVPVLSQGGLSNLYSNYAQTVNKLAPGYTGRPESASKKKRNPSNPQTPLQKKVLKERESNVIEPKKLGVNLLNMFENQPKYYSKIHKARDPNRDQARDEK